MEALMSKLVVLAALVAVNASVAIAGSAGPAPAFSLARDSGTGAEPVSVAAGDLNGGGHVAAKTPGPGSVVASSALAGARAGAEPSSPGSGTVVFSSNRDGGFEIYAVNPDGTGLTQLTQNRLEEDSPPVPSPDGRLLAFQDSGLSTVMNADGTGRHELRDCPSFSVSAWSPDSMRLVCGGGSSGLWIVDAASGTGTRLTPSGDDGSWSPDGQTIAFADKARLWVVPAVGGRPRRIGRREPWDVTSWSSDSQRVAYASEVGTGRARRLDLFTIAADGTEERRLVQAIADSPPQWSPDGSLIAFARRGGVYVVRAGGSSLRRIVASTGGELMSDVAWADDGGALLYSRQRYRGADDTDVYVISLADRTSRALTQPFPTGGTNSGAKWRPGPPVSGMPPLPPRLTLPLARRQSLTDPVEQIAADGRRVVAYPQCPRLIVWNSSTGRTVRTPTHCGSIEQVVLAGRRLAFTTFAGGNTEVSSELAVLRLGSHRPIIVTKTVAPIGGGGDLIANLVGGDGAIAFTNYHNPGGRREKRQAWILLARHGSRCPVSAEEGPPARLCRRLAGAAGGVTAAIDAGRILTVAPSGAARLLSLRGRVLRSLRLGRSIVSARFGGRTIAVQRGVCGKNVEGPAPVTDVVGRFGCTLLPSIDTYDATRGARKRTRPLATDGGPPPWLLDVRGDLVVYRTGGALHLLRLSDGHDVALDLPGAAPPFDARLEPRGLFLAWNQTYRRRPGRLAFVPARSYRGSGRLRPRVDYGPVAKDNGYGRAIATGDLNGDSRPDLVPPRSRSDLVLLSKPGLCTVPGTVLPGGGKVNLVVSRGRRPS
jgi:Tol biopolymer transport system component